MPTAGFDAFLTDLCTQSGQQGAAAAVPGVVPRAWQIPSTYPLGVDPAVPVGFAVACDRTDLNALAVEAYQRGNNPNDDVGRVGVVIAAKLAVDYVACFERALHARHASPVRLRAWAAARRAGHADATYGVFGTVSRYAHSLVEQATAAPNSQEG